MVEHADIIMALWNGTPGGTSNCLLYARQCKKPITNYWDTYLELEVF
jgi:hypothetical protein